MPWTDWWEKDGKVDYRLLEEALGGKAKDVDYRAANRGEIPTFRIGRRLLVPSAKLLALLGIDFTRQPSDELVSAGRQDR